MDLKETDDEVLVSGLVEIILGKVASGMVGRMVKFHRAEGTSGKD